MTFSVIIPLYNKALYIRRALDSVLAQTAGDFEVVVIDDGSTDGSVPVVQSITDGRLRLVRQPNGGVSEARNRGMREAAGDWLAFLDADDEWYPDFLKKAARFIGANPDTTTVFTNIMSASDLAPWLFHVPRAAERVDDYFQFCVRNKGRGMTSSSVLVRKTALNRAGGFPAGVHLSEDSDTWIRLALSGGVACIPDVLAVYHNEKTPFVRRPAHPVFPQGVNTLRQKRSQGLIPPRLLGSSRTLQALFLLQHANDLIDCGDRPAALRILRGEGLASFRQLAPLSRTVGRLARSYLKSGLSAGAAETHLQRQDG